MDEVLRFEMGSILVSRAWSFFFAFHKVVNLQKGHIVMAPSKMGIPAAFGSEAIYCNLMQFLQMLVDPMNLNAYHGLGAYLASKERRDSSKKIFQDTLLKGTLVPHSLKTVSWILIGGTRPHSCQKLF